MSRHSDPTREGYTPTTDEVRDAYVVGVSPHVTARYRAEFDRWFAEAVRAAKAEAWDEGWEACHKFMGRGIFPPVTNPYRQGADDE